MRDCAVKDKRYFSGAHTCAPARLPYIPYQVVNAQQQGLYASRRVGVSGCADGQEAPQELGQELQREALQQWLAAPVKLKQLMTDRFEQLRKTTSTKERGKRKSVNVTIAW